MRSVANTLFSGITVLGLLFTTTQAGDLQFQSEHIEITVREGGCLVEGEYRFMNASEKSLTQFPLYYPFPVSKDLPFPDSIVVTNTASDEMIPHSLTSGGILFRIDVPGTGGCSYMVRYLQSAPANRFEYILLSTRQWAQPLRKAEFVIHIPENRQLEHMSHEANSISEKEGVRSYTILRENFLPQSNLILSWK
ncbi:hypothetical protein ACFL6Q_01510 [Candidatus Neomarinimicrobiota bacterium]